MQIVEIKNNLAKIIYNPEKENLLLSSFVIVQNSSQKFLAQVINLDAKAENNFAIIKMLFSFDKMKGFVPYDGAVPSIESFISTIDNRHVMTLLESNQPLILGQILEETFSIDLSLLKEKTLACIENKDEYQRLLETIIQQILKCGGKAVLFDLMGDIKVPNKFIAGENLKLPLNYETINFIYEKGLSDASGETKAVIQDIFLEVQNYVKEIPEKYIPFETFKSVVDAQCEELKLNELVLLKNKLLKYYETGVFAQEQYEFENLRNTLITSPLTVIDISKFDGMLQREFISYIYYLMKETGLEYFSFVQIDDDNTDKKLLKQFFTTNNVYSLIISPYKYKYLKEIKQLSKNLILFAPIQQQDDFAGYNVFLSKLNHGEFIVYGDKTKYIPFIISLFPEDEKTEEVPVEQQTVETANEQTISEQQEVQVIEEEQPIENIEKQSLINEVEEEPLVNEVEQQIPDEQIVQEIENEQVYEQQVQPEKIQDYEQNLEDDVVNQPIEQEEVTVQDNHEFNEQTLEDELVSSENISVDESIRQDLDRMESIPASDVQTPDDSILTDEDLDFIQENMEQNEFVSQDEQIIQQPQEFVQPDDEFVPPELQEQYAQTQQENQIQQEAQHVEQMIQQPQEFVQPDDEFVPPHLQEQYMQAQQENQIQQELQQAEQMIQQNMQTPPPLPPTYDPEKVKETPIVPVYPAENPQTSKSEGQFVQGDEVMHETYGKGVITKIISYGDKVLCSIEFENAGKKLLDPAITKLEKI